MILDKGGGRHGHHVCVSSIIGGGADDCDPKWRMVQQRKLMRRQDGEGGGTSKACTVAGWQGRWWTAMIFQAHLLQLVVAMTTAGKGGR